MATKRPQARYASERCRKRDHMRRARGDRAPFVVVPCSGCGDPMMYDATRRNSRQPAYHPECGVSVRSIRKNRHKRTADLARSMGWKIPAEDA